ncbi:co-chaperone GroES [Vibrio parahaemolyticus]|nr:co-chaperone GroES [Vibrio parahaemolyticus]
MNNEAIELGKKLKPLYGQVILVGDEADKERRSKGGIILSAQEAPTHYVGRVVAVGDGRLNTNGNHVKPSVNVGDLVRYRGSMTDDFTYDGHDFIALDELEILCILPE